MSKSVEQSEYRIIFKAVENDCIGVFCEIVDGTDSDIIKLGDYFLNIIKEKLGVEE